ncbi:MAG: sigma-70 family RNA polymerase sigma factor [Thermoanaerobaculia bacterium]
MSDEERFEAGGPREADEPAVTQVLEAWKAGDDGALERLLPMVFEELRAIAGHHLRHEREGHTLQPTALVNEAYLKLRQIRGIRWHDRVHFFAFASRIMRRILVDHARGRLAAKRGAGAIPVDWVHGLEAPVEEGLGSATLIDLDRALDRLALERPKLARLVEARFFGGLTVEEAATVLECSPRTVKRDWAFARAWLLRELGLPGA